MKMCISTKILLLCGLLAVLGISLYAQSQCAVMARGNQWLTENPGFGDQEITALFGEYQVEAKSGEALGLFHTRVCANSRLLSSGGWSPRAGSAFLQRQENGSLFVGLPFDGGADFGTWAVIFQFPLPEETGAGFWDAAAINRLVGIWTGRFRYFLSRIRIVSDMSLPAVVEF
jgi:hypothetical protein